MYELLLIVEWCVVIYITDQLCNRRRFVALVTKAALWVRTVDNVRVT